MCFPEAADRSETYHPYRYHHPVTLGELARMMREAGLEPRGARTFLWVVKTLPDSLLAAGRALESMAEGVPLIRRLGATTLIWATRA
jgi:hypothetical protein